MIGIEALRDKIRELELMAIGIGISTEFVLKNVSIFSYLQEEYEPTQYCWSEVPENFKATRRDALRNFQIWYSSAYQLVKEYVPEQENDFKRNYNEVLDFIQLNNSILDTTNNQLIIDKFENVFEIQSGILLSIPFVAEIKEFSLRKILTADFMEMEIDQAELLFKSGFERAAGAIAGIALEKHLKTLCDINKVPYKYKDTIEPLAQALHSAGKIDSTELKKIIYLGGIRNDCAHPNDVSKDKIKALIEQVKKITI